MKFVGRGFLRKRRPIKFILIPKIDPAFFHDVFQVIPVLVLADGAHQDDLGLPMGVQPPQSAASVGGAAAGKQYIATKLS